VEKNVDVNIRKFFSFLKVSFTKNWFINDSSQQLMMSSWRPSNENKKISERAVQVFFPTTSVEKYQMLANPQKTSRTLK